MKRSWSLFAFALLMLFASAALAFGETPTPPYDTNVKCLQCHSVAQVGGAFSKVDFAVGDVSLQACAKCHGPIGSGWLAHYHQLSNSRTCTQCHGDRWSAGVISYPEYTSPLSGLFINSASLTVPASQLHKIHSGTGWPVQMGIDFNTAADYGIDCADCHRPAACSACHENTVAHESHAVATYPGIGYAQSLGTGSTTVPSTCVNLSCHPIAAAGTAAFIPACSSCHLTRVQSHGYTAVMHTADVTDTVAAGGKVCGDCHQMELYAEHQRNTSSARSAECAACHPEPRGTFSAWDQTCSQGDCHAVGSAAAVHGASASGHAPLTTGDAAVCTGCHTKGDLLAIHANAVSKVDSSKTSCLVCHSTATLPSTKDCTTCHFTYANHSYPTAAHLSSWTLANCGGAGCHGTRDLLGVHTEKNSAFACSTCHSSTNTKVAAALAAGLTGCGDCHDGITQASGHDARHWANPLLSDGSGPHYGYGTGSSSTTPSGDCTGCHTSNLIAEHLGQVDSATGNTVRDPRRDSQGGLRARTWCMKV